MQQVISGPIAPASRHDGAAIAQAQRIGFDSVLQDTFAVFARYPVPILACSLLCFASVVITGALSYAAIMLHGMSTQAGYFALAASTFYLQMQVQAAIGAFTFLLGRGAITWIALRAPAGADDPADVGITVRAAFGATLRRWQPLLASSLIYGLLITLSLIGITWMLRELRLDESNYRWVRRDANSILNLTVVRAISQLPPDPGSPFTELYSATRYHLRRQSGIYLGWTNYQSSVSNLSMPFLAAGVAGMLLAFATEVLLCMRTASIMHAPQGGALRWLMPTLRLSLAHFWRVAAWRWGVRLAVVVLYVACLTLPIALHQGIVLPAMVSEVRSYWPYPVNMSAYAIGTALVGMFAVAFGLVFEARMYLALVGVRQRPTVGSSTEHSLIGHLG